MATVSEHYSNFLAPVYVWMSGGWDAALAQGKVDVASFSPSLVSRNLAIDLGAGFGMHAIPLAQRGYSVIAIDTSAHLLSTLRDRCDGLPIRTVEADLLDFPNYLHKPVDLFLCLGDTLTHLEAQESVLELFSKIASSFAKSGILVLTFRDYTHLPVGPQRFILVRSDVNRILACFLEERQKQVLVHDILHEREGSEWKMKVSSYMKLRLDPAWVVSSLESLEFRVQRSAAPRGMIRVIATGA